MLRAIVVDDEELSVKRMKRILSESGQIEVVGAFLNPLEAYEFAKTNPIDVAFLDISMRGMNGLKLSEALLEDGAAIDIVFVTSHDNYAVQAFDLEACDYVMKPLTAERMARTLNKLRRGHSARGAVPSLQIRLFNGFQISRAGQEMLLKLRSPKTEELFAFLICKKSVGREEIADTLWSDLPPEKAWKNLNSTLYYIRKAIGTDNMSGERPAIMTDKNEVRFEANGIFCDMYEFERLLKQARHLPGNSAVLFQQIEELYAGELLRGKAYNWAGEWATRFERDYIELLEAAARYYLKLSEQQQSLHYFSQILKLDAIREDIHLEVIRIYLGLGRKFEAQRHYRELETLLQRELGSKPDPRIEEMVQQLQH